MHAAQAAEAAAAQTASGRCMSCFLQNQEDLGAYKIVHYANQAGLDAERFSQGSIARTRTCVAKHRPWPQERSSWNTDFLHQWCFHGNREGLWDAEALLEAIENSHSSQTMPLHNPLIKSSTRMRAIWHEDCRLR
jgi:hypothetical protein